MNEFLGLYPAWLEPGIGAGWVIGFIATIHVLFSHASVGAALVFAWLARRAVTANQPQHLDFIRKYGAFLLIFSYVLGSVTGPRHLVCRHNRQSPRHFGADSQLRLALGHRMGVLPH